MERRPVIGVAAQTLQAIDDIPPGLPLSWVMNSRYLTALASVAAAPVIVPLFDRDEAALRAIYDTLDGVFLAGGVDIDPASYGDSWQEGCGRTDPARDAVELRLAEWARADGKPVLGVCRGLQIVNVIAGGTLYQDCALYYPGAIKHDYFPTAGHARDYLAHDVRLEPGTRLHELVGRADWAVNSMHHQAVHTLGAGLVASAWAPDSLIEAIEDPAHPFLLAVQWHPEMLIDNDAATRRLFEAFVAAAAAHRQRDPAGSAFAV